MGFTSGTCQCRRHKFDSWVGKIPWRRDRLPSPVFLPGQSHGWRSLMGYSPQDHKKSDTTEQLHFTSPTPVFLGFPCGSAGKESPCTAGDLGSILGREDPWRRDRLPTPVFSGFPGGSDSKESAHNAGEPGLNPWVGKIPWRRAWQPTSVFLPGEIL